MPSRSARKAKTGSKRTKTNARGDTTVWCGTSGVPRLLLPENRTFSFIQNAPTLNIAQAAGTDTFSAYAFALNSLTQYTIFTAAFDQYRVDWLQLTFRPRSNMNALDAVAVAPQLITVVDYDDGAVPTLISTLEQYENVCYTVFDTQVRTIRPHANMNVDGAVAAPTASPWIDCNVAAVAHYGVKYCVTRGLGGQTALQTFAIDVRVQLSFKLVR